jgi:hypothetical protein
MRVHILTESLKARQVAGTDYSKPQFTYLSAKQIDWNDSSDRKWLMNHLHHCMMNGKKVTLTPDNAHELFRESRAATIARESI